MNLELNRCFPLSVSKSNIPLLDITISRVLSLFGMLLIYCFY